MREDTIFSMCNLNKEHFTGSMDEIQGMRTPRKHCWDETHDPKPKMAKTGGKRLLRKNDFVTSQTFKNC